MVCTMALPGATPTSPMMLASVQVTAVFARMAKFPEVPNGGVVAAAARRAFAEFEEDVAEGAVPHASAERATTEARRTFRGVRVIKGLLRAKEGNHRRRGSSGQVSGCEGADRPPHAAMSM
jgi:hypothetical protein